MLAHGAQELLDSLDDQEFAVVRAGRLLVVKYPHDGQSVVVMRVLSPAELRVLERFPEIERSPERVFDALATALTAEEEAGPLTLDRTRQQDPSSEGEANVGSAAAEPRMDRNALTQREREVLQLLAAGQSTTEIAREMGLRYSTARTHIQNMLRKLGVQSKREAVAAVVANARNRSLVPLVHELSPSLDVPTPAEVLQARRNAEARAQLLAEFGALTSAEVADLLGSEARNRNSLAHRLKKEGRLFAVSYRGTAWYPGFQFRGGNVLPQLADVLSELTCAGLGEWETALWFTARNGWLDDCRPVDLLLDEPSRVVDAASREATDLEG